MANTGGGRFEVANPVMDAAEVVLKIIPETGRTGGAVIPDPVVIETGTGVMPLGDWSEMGILNNYSGGVKYVKNVALTADEAKAGAQIDLGQVIATAEVRINAKKAGVRVAPPWKLDITGLLVEGDNTIEITVYNTISNHY